MTKNLTNHPYSQCHVELNDGGIKFVSYGWYVVIGMDADGWMSFRNPHYSATTCKQVGWFLQEYFPALTYHTVKQLYNDGMTYNYFTGEVKEQGV